VRLLQVAIPPGGDSEGHRELEEQVQARVGRINGAFGTARWTPVHYMCRWSSFEEVLALYRAADIMLVTPTGDGLDLVAHEFVAARSDEDGVLVLSERAPAASELTEAVLVNPFDIQGTARALAHALTLGAAERRSRMQALRSRVFASDAEHWSSDLPLALGTGPAVMACSTPALPAAIARAALERVSSSSPLVVLLDYDGTLVPFADRPLLAAPDAELLALLQSLSARPETEVHIVSGRSRTSLESWLGHLPGLGLHAEHGAWSRPAGDAGRERPRPPAVWRADVLDLMRQYCLEVPGSLLEQKASGLAWHYRTADPHQGVLAVQQLNSQLRRLVLHLPAQILLGDKVLEVRSRGIHKGLVVPDILARRPTAFFLAAGDDLTDEDLFAAMPGEALTIHVGSRPSRAKHRLPGPRALRDLLWSLTMVRGWQSASGMTECHVPAESGPLARPSLHGRPGGIASAAASWPMETTSMEHD
jgi:trehalose 6-phosphate synthase/phosphatase